MTSQPHCIAFVGQTRLAEGSLPEVARAIRQRLDAGELAPIAVFDAETSAPIDLDVRGTPDQAAARAEAQLISRESEAHVRPGRPKLGVVAREITLLPRHWDWLAAQPGGASVTLRKLVDAARKQGHASERIRRTQDTAYRFMHAVAGDLPGFEEAVRALYAWDQPKLEMLIAAWPPDVADHVRQILER
jgi:hypothetical protein